MRCLLLLSMRRYMRGAPWPVGWMGCTITTVWALDAFIELLKLLLLVLHFLLLKPRSIVFESIMISSNTFKWCSLTLHQFVWRVGRVVVENIGTAQQKNNIVHLCYNSVSRHGRLPSFLPMSEPSSWNTNGVTVNSPNERTCIKPGAWS